MTGADTIPTFKNLNSKYDQMFIIIKIIKLFFQRYTFLKIPRVHSRRSKIKFSKFSRRLLKLLLDVKILKNDQHYIVFAK